MYIVSVKLSLDSFETRKLLSENDFVIFLFDSLNGQLALVNEEYDALEGIEFLYFDTNNTLSFYCLYNGPYSPSQQIFRRLEEDASIMEFTITKR